MGAKTWIAVTCGVVAVLGGVALALLAGVTPATLVAAPPNAEMAPAGLVFYAEVNGLKPVWGSVSASEAWIDLQASRVAGDLKRTETGKAGLELLSQLEKKAGYAIDAKRAMYFAGRQVSIGVDALPATGDPAWVVLAKLDVDALVAEMLRGEGDWTKLQDELARRTGAMDFKVATSEHAGCTVTSATRGAVVFHAAILGDTLAVSDSLPLLTRTIDVHAAGGEGSLGRTQRFKDEIARLPKDALAYDFTDLTSLRASRAALARLVAATGSGGSVSEARSAAAERILDGTAAAPALARATDLPGGNLYEVKWTYSRTAAELAGPGAPASLSSLVAGFPIVGETQNLGAVADAWRASSLRRRFADSAFAKKFRELLDDPEQLERLADRSPFGEMSGLGAGPGDEDPGEDGEEDEQGEEDEDAAAARKSRAQARAALRAFKPDPFTMKMALQVFGRMVSGCVTGDLALAADVDEDAEPVAALAFRSGTEGYILFLALEGAATTDAKACRRTEHAGVTMYAAVRKGRELGFAWARLGDVVVISNAEATVRRVLDAAAKPAAASAAPKSALRDGWCARLRWDAGSMLGLLRERLGEEQMETLESSIAMKGEMGIYVQDAFRTVAVQSASELPADMASVDAPKEPRTWGWLPEKPILAAGGSFDFATLKTLIENRFPKSVRKELDEGLAEVSEALGVDIAGELFPALGPEVALAVTRASALPPSSKPSPAPPGRRARPDPVAIPGVLLSVEVRDEKVVARALDGAVALGEKAAEESSRGRRNQPRYVRENADGRMMVRLELPDDGAPIRIDPTAVLGKGKLLIGLDSAVVVSSLDAELGRATPFAKSALAGRIREALPEGGAAWSVLDWGATLDQIAEYTPQMAELFVPDELPSGRKKPEFPESPGAGAYEQYERDMAAYTAEAQKTVPAEVRKWIDACRVVDFIASSGRVEGRIDHRHLVVRFADQ